MWCMSGIISMDRHLQSWTKYLEQSTEAEPRGVL